MPSIHQRVATARQRLRDAGVAPAEADLDARLLAQHLLGWDAARFLASSTDAEPGAFADAYQRLIARREAHEPIAYILGVREFWNRPFAVSPAVLVPRPETEVVVEAALERLGERALVADVGTGSGCLAVTLAAERPGVRVVAVDRSRAALRVARLNALRLGVAARVRLVQGNLLAGVAGGFDLIVSNPPYVAERDRAALPRQVLDHEPSLALFAGPDGLSLIRGLVDQAPSHLAPAGVLIFEFGAGQDRAVSDSDRGLARPQNDRAPARPPGHSTDSRSAGRGITGIHPGGQSNVRPPSRWRWTWKTVWPASRLVLKTVR